MPNSEAFSMSLGLYALGAVGTVFSWFLMGWAGRRTLYLYGQIFLLIDLLAIGCTSFAGKSNIPAQWAIGSLLLVFTFIYDSTVGPVCYSLVSELSSTRLRTKSVVAARTLYNLGSIVNNVVTPNMLSPTSWNWGATSAFFFVGTTTLGLIWTYFRLPEPKNRTYGELDVLFENRVSARNFSKTVVDVAAEECDGAPMKEKPSVSEDEEVEKKR